MLCQVDSMNDRSGEYFRNVIVISCLFISMGALVAGPFFRKFLDVRIGEQMREALAKVALGLVESNKRLQHFDHGFLAINAGELYGQSWMAAQFAADQYTVAFYSAFDRSRGTRVDATAAMNAARKIDLFQFTCRGQMNRVFPAGLSACTAG